MTKILQTKIELVSNEIDSILNTAPPILMPVMEHLKLAKGKQLRAKLIISLALDFNFEDDKIIKLATATELMHLSTLVHDDVIDNAPLRRGIESVQSKFGNKLAVISGDYLYTKCFNIVANDLNNNMNEFSKTIELICIGEAYQMQNNKNFNITKRDYNKIIAGKTAVLFSLGMYSTALQVTDLSQKEIEIAGKVGFHLGMMFQLIDDYLDYFSTSFEETKKEVFKDLKEGVITYPLIHTLEKKQDLKQLLENDFSEDVINTAIQEVMSCDAKEETKKQIDFYYGLCKNKLNKIVDIKNSMTMDIIDTIYNIQYK